MATAGTISIKMVADSNPFVTGLGKAGAALKGFGKNLVSGGSGIAGFLGSFTGIAAIGPQIAAMAAALSASAIVGSLIAMTKHGLDAVDAMGDAAQRVGMTTESFSKLSYAVELSGSHMADLEPALLKMNANLDEAAASGGTAEDALNKMGLSAKNLVGLDPAEQFKQIAQAISQVAETGAKTGIIKGIFGKGGTALSNTLDQGREGLEKLEAQAVRVGYAIRDIDQIKVGAAKDAIDNLGFAWQGLENQLAIQLAPLIEKTVNLLTDMATSGSSTGEKVAMGIDAVTSAVGVAADVLETYKLGFLAFGTVATTALTYVMDAFLLFEKPLFKLIDLIPGLGTNLSVELDIVAGTLHQMAAASAENFNKELMKAPPSEGIKKFFGDMTSAADLAAAATRNAVKETKKLEEDTAKGVTALTDKLNEQIDTFGYSATSVELYKLSVAGASEADLAEARNLGIKLEGLEEDKKAREEVIATAKKAQEDLESAAKATIESVLTPMEKAVKQRAELQKQLDAGLITNEVFKKAAAKIEGVGDETAAKHAGALELGSKESRTAILAHEGIGQADAMKKTAENAAAQTGLQREMVRILGLSLDAFKTPAPAFNI